MLGNWDGRCTSTSRLEHKGEPKRNEYNPALETKPDKAEARQRLGWTPIRGVGARSVAQAQARKEEVIAEMDK